MPRFVQDLPIWVKFFAASSVLLFCLLWLGTNSYLTLDKSAEGLNRLSTVYLPTQQSVSDLAHDAMSAHAKVSRYIIWVNNGATEQLIGTLGQDIEADFDSVRRRLELLAKRADLQRLERDGMMPLTARWMKYTQSARNTIEVGRAVPEMATMMMGSADDDFRGFAESLQYIAFLVARETQTASRQLAAEAESKKHLLALGGLLSVLASIFVTLFVGGSVVRPIRAVTTAMKRVSSGELAVDPGYNQRKDEIGQMVAAIAVFRQNIDLRNRLLKQRKEELHRQNTRFDAALNNMCQGLAMFDSEQRLVVSNSRYAELYGLSPEQIAPGTTVGEIIGRRIAKGLYKNALPEEYEPDHLASVETFNSSIHELSDGRVIAVTRKPMPEGGWVTTHEDVTEKKRNEKRIAHMAQHDALTSLPNRVLLNERLEEALAHIRNGEVVAIHLVDLDRFKNVNDTLGHLSGDRLLQMVAERLRRLVRGTDTVARMGGDEFAIVQRAIEGETEAAALASRVIDSLSKPYALGGHQATIGSSVGIAIGKVDDLDPEQLLRNADLALYRAKGDGRGTYRVFEPEMDAQTRMRRVMEFDLRKALLAGEFEVHYQPVVRLETDTISGFEALVRWRHPSRGMIPPDAFIPMAEEIGLIAPLGEWVLRHACAAAVKWPGHIRVSVNLSSVQFRHAGLAGVVTEALASSGLPPDRLEIEITETVFLEDSEATLAVLYELRELGVRVVMDDFGTGYSSLRYLQSFPFDKIKIDRSFVKDIAHCAGSLNIVRAVVALAHGLGMTTTAEGVETQEQLAVLRAEGCTEMQGFLFSKAVPDGQIEALLVAKEKPAGGAGLVCAA
ncbi:MAG: EAL domain-containing protein [Hyphomicrobiaceae bacterium]|nr:MAG: EAL domain-containing protein [Hyphomicrobiaceae bacterium]